MIGKIFDIKEFSTRDGPGIRTTVFFKGCPLNCVWCHNPEGISFNSQLMVKTARCKGCGKCQKECSHPECAPFERCLHICPEGLISLCGEDITAEKLAEKLLKNVEFYENGGGITFSGGEPLAQAKFLEEVIEKLDGKLHLAIETSGFAKPQVFERIINLLDYIMMDIKLADSVEHKKYTGVDNDLILENLKILQKSNKEYVIRVPLIPGITDSEENLKEIAHLVGDSRVELLPYNDLAGAKYPMIGKEYPLDINGKSKPDISFFKNAVLL